MARLFVSPRDAQFISDITKELMKDVVGAKVYYYRVMHDLTQVNETYNEAKEIVYDDPIAIDVLLKFTNQEVRTGKFGKEKYKELDVHFHHEDLVDRDIAPREGDLIAWGDNFYEIFETTKETELWGLVEFEIGVGVQAKQVQFGAIQAPLEKPVGRRNEDIDGEDGNLWQQSRGKEQYSDGQPTQDRRRHIDKDQWDPPEHQMKQSPLGEPPRQRSQASFYDDFDEEGFD